MPAPHEELRAVGIEPEADFGRPALRLECARLALRLREQEARAVGLAPAGEDVAVPAVAIQLGRALAEAGAARVGVLDALGSWPGARALADGAAGGGGALAGSWLLENLVLLTPRSLLPGAALDLLRAVLAQGGPGFGHLVVDLTGFERLGQHLAASELLDGVAVVARRGRTTARQLERWLGDLPAARRLGVLLTGL